MNCDYYTYTDADGRFIGVYPQPDFSRIILGRNGGTNVSLAMKDAPEFALAILTAAGHGKRTDGAELGPDYAAIKLRQYVEARAEVALVDAKQKRRDELAKELNGGGIDAAYDTWAGQPMPLRDAIDRIIELESVS